jgi:hypothetical protein
MAANTIKVVGLDPSLSNFGVAQATIDLDTMAVTITNLRLISTEVEKDKKVRKQVRQNSQDLDRAQILHKGLQEVCDGHWLAIAEVPVGSQSARAMASYGVCIGVLASCPLPLIQVTPGEVKMAGAGVKTATKDEMIEWAMKKHPDANWLTMRRGGVMVPIGKNEHLADAVAAIYAGIETDQFQQMIAMIKGSPIMKGMVFPA